jgi:hypothetical protein
MHLTFFTSTGDAGCIDHLIIIDQRNSQMNHDQYKVGQAAAVGPRAHAHDVVFNQILNESAEKVDALQLALELSALRTALVSVATAPEQYVAIGEIAAAETAAKNGDRPKALQHLKSAGSWVWDIGTKVGIGVATAAAKSALGL